MIYHQPVLLTEVLKLIDPRPGDLIIDGTLGHGGHSQQFLEAGAKVIGFDYDPEAIKTASGRINSSQLRTINKNFIDIPAFILENNIHPQAILLDLGLNLNQYKSDRRGFTFMTDEPLDMRLNPEQELTAEEIINTYSEADLYRLFSTLSQDKLSRPLARSIIRHRQRRPIKSSLVLASIISEVYEYFHFRPSTHPATKIFMALRIEVNHEFDNLKKFLADSLQLKNILIAIITFHSGEDRIVKRFLSQHPRLSAGKPQKPSLEEIRTNPLSRSALLRSYKIN